MKTLLKKTVATITTVVTVTSFVPAIEKHLPQTFKIPPVKSCVMQTVAVPIETAPKSTSNEEQINYLYISQRLYDFVLRKKECYSTKKNYAYHYLFFCSTIAYLENVDKRYKEKKYVNINYKIMTSIISKNIYSEMVGKLIRWGVIETNNSYQARNYSKGYSLKPPYNNNIKRVPINDKLINQKINLFKMKSRKRIEKLPYPYQYLSMTNTWIKMDVANALWYNETNYLTQYVEKYNANLYSIFAYEDEWYRFTVDSTGNRAHTNLTNLGSYLRQFLSVENEQLGQVDICNSQPLFFYLHIKNLSFIPQDEKDRYRAIVENGRFYEFFMERLNIASNKRTKVKHKILAAVFFDKYRKKESKYVKVFRQDFPSILGYITKLRKRDHTMLAKILQKGESKFVIEKVVGGFVKQFGADSEFISTIHDSIVVKTSMLDTAKEIMQKCFWKEGIYPQLSVSVF